MGENVKVGRSAYTSREFEYKRLEEALALRKKEQQRRLKQQELLEEIYDKALLDAFGSALKQRIPEPGID